MRLYILLFVFYFFSSITVGQQKSAFDEEVRQIVQKYDTLWDPKQETVVFAGSSSIGMWTDLASRFPGQQVINSGFGGSQASNLLLHYDKLILRYRPKTVFIYEGDNDIVHKKKTKEIIRDIKKIIHHIQEVDPHTQIVLIAAKPSIARWHLKRKYKRLNKQFQKLARKETGVAYADIWNAMLLDRKVRPDLFLEDKLHLNQKGYDIWQAVLTPFMKNTSTPTDF